MVPFGEDNMMNGVKMSNKDKQTVIDARKKKGGKDSRPIQASDVSTDNIAAPRTKLDDIHRTLAAVKSSSQGNSTTDTPDDNAGDSFGGRQSKQLKSDRVVSAYSSSSRRNLSQTTSRVRNDRTTYNKVELDLHADTAVLDSNCLILQYSSRECDVTPYTDSYQAIPGVQCTDCHWSFCLDITQHQWNLHFGFSQSVMDG